MKIIINEPQAPKNDYRENYQKFGNWEDNNRKIKSDAEILDYIFTERASKTIGGCSKCGTPYINFTPVKKTTAYRCKCQKTKIYPLKGTHLENFRKPLTLVMKVAYDMLVNRNGVSALSFLRKYKVCEKTANLLSRRISDWIHWYLMQQEFTPGSIIEIDEVYPKFNTDLGEYYPWKRGKGSERTHGVLVMCQRNGLSLAIPYDKRKKGEVLRLIKKHIRKEDNHHIFTDESTEYSKLLGEGYRHSWVNHREQNFGEGDVNTNLAENLNSFIKNTIEFTHKGVYADYLKLYMSRYAFVHAIRKKTFEQCIQVLVSSLPPLNEKVKVNFKPNSNYIRYAA